MAAGALVAGGVFAARRRASRTVADPFADYARRFWLSHEALRRNLDRFVEIAERDEPVDRTALGQYLDLYGKFLTVHHDAEDEVIFPTLRRHGRLHTTDAAHLDGWTAEHRQVNAAGEALTRAGQGLGSRGEALAEVGRMSRELRDLLRPHLASEEELFTAARLAEVGPAPGHRRDRPRRSPPLRPRAGAPPVLRPLAQ